MHTHTSARCAIDLQMRFLAPYTVYDGAVYRLHLFDVAPDGGVSHRPVEEETAYTLYVQGIAIVAASDLDTHSVACRIREMGGCRLKDVSEAIAGMDLPGGTAVYVATFPFQAVRKI